MFAVVVGCGDDDSPPTPSPPPDNVEEEGRPITDEALVLARVLQQNWQGQGAAFTGEIDVRGVTIPMVGRVDFRSGRGTATLREPSAASRRYVWTRRAVYAQAEPGSRRYDVQPPDAESDPVHSAIALINLLSAETIDNTANIRDQGARFLRGETLDGTPVDVYRLRPDLLDRSRRRTAAPGGSPLPRRRPRSRHAHQPRGRARVAAALRALTPRKPPARNPPFRPTTFA